MRPLAVLGLDDSSAQEGEKLQIFEAEHNRESLGGKSGRIQ